MFVGVLCTAVISGVVYNQILKGQGIGGCINDGEIDVELVCSKQEDERTEKEGEEDEAGGHKIPAV